VIVEGRVPDGYIAAAVLKTVKAYLLSVQAGQVSKVKSKVQMSPGEGEGPKPAAQPDDEPREGETAPDVDKPDIEATIPLPQVISLLRTTHHDSLDTLHLTLKEKFPGASIRVQRTGRAIVAEGQARDARQVDSILSVIDAYLESVLADEAALLDAANAIDGAGADAKVGGNDKERPGVDVNVDGDEEDERSVVAKPRIINLIQVPGPQQVMLKVEVAELNRTAFRAIGLNFLQFDGNEVIGTRVGNNPAGFASLFLPSSNPAATVFGILDDGDFQFVLNALRQNQVFKVLAEPTLVAMNGQEASFLAGGSFPVPVPQSGAGGGNPTITVQYKEFGVSLDFKPFILDEDTIRLSVGTEVSSIDRNLGLDVPDFGGVPALNERRASTTVQLKEGKTLAIAGLLQVTLEGNTDRIPGLGDLEYIGPFFSNTDSRTVEKELVVLITPYIVDGMDRHEVPCRPGDMVEEPDDWELYLQNRIEKRNCKPYRATSAWYDTFHIRQRYCKWEETNVVGPHGYSD
jgi:pilus assembly protein CpaC